MEMSQYITKRYEPFWGDVNVKVDLSSYATKVDRSKLAAQKCNKNRYN